MDKLEALKRPFEAHEIEWRVQQSGVKNGKPWAMVLAYVTNRAIMDRLDEVFGLTGWKNEFAPTPAIDGVMCGISIKHEGEWITKYDGAENTQIEAVKGGLSSSMKRTAVQFGIGRYLYHLESNFANVIEGRQAGSKSAKAKDPATGKDIWFNWLPPELPNFALPISKDQTKLIREELDRTGVIEEDMLKAFDYKALKNITKELAVTLIQMLKKKPNKKEAQK